MKRLLATLIILTAFTTGASACPMCKDSVSNREGETNELHDSYTTGGQNIAGGMNVSVYVMLGTLFGMAPGMVLFAWAGALLPSAEAIEHHQLPGPMGDLLHGLS